ncbi:MAG: two-component system sensor histidine kinase NtrB [Alphaproteobacteria bacterium]
MSARPSAKPAGPPSTGPSAAALAPALLNALPHPVLDIAADGRIAAANQAAEQFFQTSEAVLIRHGIDRFIPFGSPLFGLIDQTREWGSAVTEYRVDIGTPRTGMERIVDIYGAPVPEQPGHVVIMFLARTVTEKIDRQLTHRGAARSVNGLAAMLAHEIRNPLAGIRGAAQLIETSVSADDQVLTRLIRDETDRIVDLVDRMDVFSDDRPVDRTRVNIHAILDRVKMLAESGLASSATILIDYDPSLPAMYANGDQLLQVFINLVKNAAEAVEGRANATITLRTAYRPGIRLATPGSPTRVSLPLEFSVIDNGPGVTDELRPYIFDPFVTSKGNGTGLGLALVAKIIGDHGGIVECDSKPGRTAFRILMPAYDADRSYQDSTGGQGTDTPPPATVSA